jgi:hypothetical protein
MTRRSRILTNLLLGLPLATALLSGIPPAAAQTNASFTVPFAFSAGDHNMPAGSYSVERQSDRFLYLRNLKTGHVHVFLMVRPDDSGRVNDTGGRLVFQRYGTRNYLKQVWIGRTNIHSDLVVQSRTERELAKAPAPAGSTLEVASK